MCKLKNSKIVYKGKIIEVKVDKIILPSGKETIREVVVFPSTVVVLPIFENKIIFVEQFRYPINKNLLELPAGKVDSGEKSEYTAKRELLEETGFEAKKIKKLAGFYLTPGYSTEFMELYLAYDLKKVSDIEDKDEINKVIFMEIQEVERKLKEGFFEDGKTILALSFYFYNYK